MRAWLVLAGILGALCVCPSARADVFDDNPAAVAVGPGNVFVFARGADGTILSRHFSAGAWTDWTPVPGLVAGSGPGALVYGDTILLFARGADGAVWQNTFTSSGWLGWISLGGQASSAPAAGLRLGTTTADLVVRGTDNGLYHRTLVPGQGWSAWEALGGNVGSAPTVTGYTPQGTIDVFVRDATGPLFQWYRDANGWQGPTSYGGVLNGAPTSTFAVQNWLDIYARGTDNTLFHLHHPGGTWQRVSATPLTSAPTATSDTANHEIVFARIGGDLHWMSVNAAGTDGAVYSGWTSLGPIAAPVAPAPPPAPAPAPTPLVTLAPSLTYNFKASRRSTRLTSLVVKSIPAGATVVVSCRRGCSAKKWTRRNVRGTLSLRRFIRRSLRVGTTITVTVSKPGTITAIKTLKIRARKAPSITTRCLAPGAAKPQRC